MRIKIKTIRVLMASVLLMITVSLSAQIKVNLSGYVGINC